MILYKLDKNISMEKLAQDINRLLERETIEPANTFLCVSLKKITYDDTSHIPKITYNPPDSPI